MKKETNKHTYEDSVTRNGFKVIDCKSCGFWHVYPIPDNETLDKYYQDQYYQNSTEHGEMKDKENDPDGYYKLKHSDKLKNFERLLPDNAEKSILDLGAGFGDFLEYMRSKGWFVCGIEHSETCMKKNRWKDCNISLASMDIIDKMKLERTYSVITLNTVLEHVPYPEKILTSIRDNLMDSNTILHVEVPNDFSLLQDAVNTTCNQKHYWLCPLAHLNYWNFETFTKFVTKLGFKLEIMESTFPLEIMAMLGDDYITCPEKGRMIHMKRVEMEKRFADTGNIDLKLKLYQGFAQMGIGRDILFYLRKN